MKHTSIYCVLLLCALNLGGVIAQVHKRDFTNAKTTLGVPTICVDEILAGNFNKDCISLVGVRSSVCQQAPQYWHPGRILPSQGPPNHDHDQ